MISKVEGRYSGIYLHSSEGMNGLNLGTRKCYLGERPDDYTSSTIEYESVKFKTMYLFVWNLDFIARLACTLSIANTLSPAPTFIFALKNKVKVESISSFYLTTGLISTIIWLMYGSKKRDMSLILSNGAALALLLLYIFFLHYLNSHWK